MSIKRKLYAASGAIVCGYKFWKDLAVYVFTGRDPKEFHSSEMFGFRSGGTFDYIIEDIETEGTGMYGHNVTNLVVEYFRSRPQLAAKMSCGLVMALSITNAVAIVAMLLG